MPVRPPRVIDLFCGAGGLALGFRAAGCRIQAMVDIDDAAGETVEENFRLLQPEDPPQVLAGVDSDLEQLRPADILAGDPPPDIVLGGPPCQGFALIGRAKLHSLDDESFAGDPRNELYRVFVRAVAEWQPQAFVMENVPGMLSVDGRNVAAEAAEELASRGYKVGYAVLNAVWYGVPQYRSRLFLIGVRQDLGRWPTVPPATHKLVLPPGYPSSPACVQIPMEFIHHAELLVDRSRPQRDSVTVQQAIGDLPELLDHREGYARPRVNFRRERPYAGPPGSDFARLMRNWPGLPQALAVVDHVVRRTPRDYDTFARMKPGDRYPEALRIAEERLAEEVHARHAAGKDFDEAQLRDEIVPPYPVTIFVDKWRKLIREQPSWTVVAHLARDTYSHIHYDGGQARMISIREAARLQAFPDAYQFCGSMNDCFQQIGNAVPPLMAWAIASTLLEVLGIESHPPPH